MVDERLRFIAKLLDGESMTHLCREFGISRKTGYKIFSRYNESGFEALSDRCRRPVRYANQLPPQIEHLIVGCKREKPHWGARKTRELLVRRLDQDVRIPAKSTIHAVLHRHGLVKGIGPAASSRNRHRALRWRDLASIGRTPTYAAIRPVSMCAGVRYPMDECKRRRL